MLSTNNPKCLLARSMPGNEILLSGKICFVKNLVEIGGSWEGLFEQFPLNVPTNIFRAAKILSYLTQIVCLLTDLFAAFYSKFFSSYEGEVTKKWNPQFLLECWCGHCLVPNTHCLLHETSCLFVVYTRKIFAFLKGVFFL